MLSSRKRLGKCFMLINAVMGVHVSNRELREQGRSCSRKRVARLMQEAQLSAKRKRRRVLTTKRDLTHPVAPHLLNREFTATEPNKKWVTDITSIPTAQGWHNAAVILDLYSRIVVGWRVLEPL